MLSSGFTVTYAHHCIIQGNRSGALYGLILTVTLAFFFTVLQAAEYSVSSFTISDSSFGSCFYFGTGFHGLTNKAPNNLITSTYIKARNIHYTKIFSRTYLNTNSNTNNKKDKLIIR